MLNEVLMTDACEAWRDAAQLKCLWWLFSPAIFFFLYYAPNIQ